MKATVKNAIRLAPFSIDDAWIVEYLKELERYGRESKFCKSNLSQWIKFLNAQPNPPESLLDVDRAAYESFVEYLKTGGLSLASISNIFIEVKRFYLFLEEHVPADAGRVCAPDFSLTRNGNIVKPRKRIIPIKHDRADCTFDFLKLPRAKWFFSYAEKKRHNTGELSKNNIPAGC